MCSPLPPSLAPPLHTLTHLTHHFAPFVAHQSLIQKKCAPWCNELLLLAMAGALGYQNPVPMLSATVSEGMVPPNLLFPIPLPTLSLTMALVADQICQ